MNAGKANPAISGFPTPTPSGWYERPGAAAHFYAPFRHLFRQVGRWFTGTPFERRT